jgi:hypothetical protein
MVAMAYKQYHAILEHPNNCTLQETAKQKGIILTEVPKEELIAPTPK